MRPPLTAEKILSRLLVDIATGRCYWKVPSKYHPDLLGKEAGSLQRCSHGGDRWIVKINGIQYRRSYLIFVVANGYWPSLIDHIDGDSLNDGFCNLREATVTQNAWNHRKRKKSAQTPMGVRILNGRFQARIGLYRKQIHLGTFDSAEEAQAVYLQKRKELYGDYCGL